MMDKIISFVGRFFLSAIFLMSAINKITNFSGTQQYMAIYKMPWTGFFLVCAIIIELLGGLSILFNYKAKIGAIALVIFIIPATIIFHTKFSDQIQIIMFMKNLSILGGLLLVIRFGDRL